MSIDDARNDCFDSDIVPSHVRDCNVFIMIRVSSRANITPVYLASSASYHSNSAIISSTLYITRGGHARIYVEDTRRPRKLKDTSFSWPGNVTGIVSRRVSFRPFLSTYTRKLNHFWSFLRRRRASTRYEDAIVKRVRIDHELQRHSSRAVHSNRNRVVDATQISILRDRRLKKKKKKKKKEELVGTSVYWLCAFNYCPTCDAIRVYFLDSFASCISWNRARLLQRMCIDEEYIRSRFQFLSKFLDVIFRFPSFRMTIRSTGQEIASRFPEFVPRAEMSMDKQRGYFSPFRRSISSLIIRKFR